MREQHTDTLPSLCLQRREDRWPTQISFLKTSRNCLRTGRRRSRRRWPLLLLLLLLLLLCSVTSVVDVFIDRKPDEARFIARNLECLQCHTELIPDFDTRLGPQPVHAAECTVCHTPHGKDVERTIVSGGSRTFERRTAQFSAMASPQVRAWSVGQLPRG